MRGLAARNYLRNVFRSGSYHPLTVSGEQANHVITFVRHKGEHTVLTVVPRFFDWARSALQAAHRQIGMGRYCD